jgi:DNA polymerase III subunit delta
MIFYIYGTDNYLCQEKLKEVTTGFSEKKDKGGLNIIRLEAGEIDLSRFSQEILTVPFLSERKMIIVKGLFNENSKARKELRDEILNFLKEKKDKLENNLLFFDVFENVKKLPEKDKLFALLKNEKYAWYLPALNNQELGNWIKSYCQKHQVNLTVGALSELIALVGNDLLQLTKELAKLKAYRLKEAILKENVDLLVNAKYDENVFNLTDALASKNRAVSLKLIADQLASGNEPLSLLGSINWQFKTLLKIKSLLEKNSTLTAYQLSAETGLHSYVISKNLTAVRKFTLRELINIQNDLLEIEKQLKFGAKNPELLFDLFVAKKLLTVKPEKDTINTVAFCVDATKYL